jgi:putative endonuclease
MNQLEKRGFKNKIGALGEQVCVNYLTRKGFIIIETNYLKKWGEIDIVARGTDQKVHFIEVKTVSYETKATLHHSVTHGTWRPEENVHAFKLKKLVRVIESWLMEHEYNGDWQIDVVSVRIVEHEKYATVNHISNI